jgi:hypothetical protein
MVLAALGVTRAELTGADREVCQTLAELAALAGFEAIVAPSAASIDDTTLVVVAPAIDTRSHDVIDLGVRAPPTT